VDYYTYAWTDDPIVQSTIAESGAATSFSDPAPPNNTDAWYNATELLGCGDSSVDLSTTVECMRTKSFEAILNATRVDNPIKAVLGNFGPTADEQVVFSDYDALGSAGQFIRKPYLIGNNNYEAGLFKLQAIIAGASFPNTAWCLFNSDVFTCPVSAAAGYRAQYNVPTYRYRYFGEFPNLRLTVDPNSGAWHGSEIPIIFGTAPDASGEPNTLAETSISYYLQGAWAAFAKDPENAFTDFPYWYPTYDSDSKFPLELQIAFKTENWCR
jgi:cholinesterase